MLAWRAEATEADDAEAADCEAAAALEELATAAVSTSKILQVIIVSVHTHEWSSRASSAFTPPRTGRPTPRRNVRSLERLLTHSVHRP